MAPAATPWRNPDEPASMPFSTRCRGLVALCQGSPLLGHNGKEVCAPLRRAHLPRNEEAGWGAGYITYHPQFWRGPLYPEPGRRGLFPRTHIASFAHVSMAPMGM
ncbi:hypothetical protein ODE01S_14490 [Oceanithermus desulfurans NBRC 100063]|uniref:Uncharacterized protein n=1 Tax=Oceanithermus desulfurans NBRC 100063 TaxID=1227550 RepID=A0A511RK57_9DEIN|nr:hypothetical protein ODE01S_14490 [Oceanithermus desulfurans NBRC 100063]